MTRRPLHRWLFAVRRSHLAALETIEVVAYDSYAAIRELPDDLVYWDFKQFGDGRYSVPVEEQAVA